MTEVQPIDHFSNTAEYQHFDLDDKDDDGFDLHFSFDDLFTDEQGIIGDAFGADRKDDGVVVEVLDCARAVNHESGDRSFDCLVGDWSRNTGDLSRATSTKVSGNAASRSGATEASDRKIEVEAKYMSYRKDESEDGTEDEKMKARLKRNRESAQMSRERKKHYVEELEEKVRAMHATIADLNCKFSYLMAENVSLRLQIGGVVTDGIAYPRCPMVPMGYSWMPSLPHALNGSQTHVLPIISVKPQSSAQSSMSKKLNGNNSGSKKTKNVASISLLGLLVFVFLIGGLVPMMNTNYGGPATSESQDRIFTVNFGANRYGSRVEMESGVSKEMNDYDENYRNSYVKGKQEAKTGSGKSAEDGNLSRPLVASLYVLRNQQLVKIDGNLIIHSVLAGGKDMSSQEAISLPVAKNVAPANAYSEAVKNRNKQQSHMDRNGSERQKSLADSYKASADDPQQWFREGSEGPKLSSGLCTEVFQSDMSPEANPGAVVPASSAGNISSTNHQSNSNQLTERTNNKNLHSLPNVATMTEEHMESKYTKYSYDGKRPSVVVSVRIDPKESPDDKGSDGIMGSKALPRIFVVVLLERVRYVTYSCVIPVN